MATEKDLLLDTLSTDQYGVRSDRLHYATGEMLGADDFRAEQLYHRRQLAMALRFLCGSGTLAGLKVAAVPGDPDEDDPANLTDVKIQVNPGLAIDRVGRLVEVPVPVSLRLKKWFSYIIDPEKTGEPHAADRLAAVYHSPTKTVAADVFIKFYPCERGWTPTFATGPFDALDASQPSRVRDAYELRLVLCKVTDFPEAYDPWGTVTDSATKTEVQDAILAAWETLQPPKEGTGGFNEVPAELEDPTAIRLARLTVPVISAGAPATVEDLDWTVETWTQEPLSLVDNSIRNFIVPPALLRRLHNL